MSETWREELARANAARARAELERDEARKERNEAQIHLGRLLRQLALLGDSLGIDLGPPSQGKEERDAILGRFIEGAQNGWGEK